MIECRHPLNERAITNLLTYQAVITWIDITPVFQLCSVRKLIYWCGTKDSAETIQCRTCIIGPKTLTILITLEIKTTISLIQNLIPSMQLGKVTETASWLKEIIKLLFYLVCTEILRFHETLCKQIAHSNSSKCKTQVVGSLTIEIIKDLICQ